MSKNSVLLTELYNKAKQKRIVLNKDEFAKALNYSRSHLHRLMSGQDDVSNELVSKAMEIVNGTKNVVFDVIKVGQADVGKEIGKLKEREIYLSASVTVLEQMVDELVSRQTGQPIALVSGQRKQAVGMEVDRLFAEERKKHKQV